MHSSGLFECRKNDGIEKVKYLLQADGWVNDTSGRGRVDAYYKRGIPLGIEVGIINWHGQYPTIST